MHLRFHKNDLSDLTSYETVSQIAIDTETSGLDLHRDRLCLVQLSPGDQTVDLIQITRGQSEAPVLCRLLQDKRFKKIFHYARFDLMSLYKTFGVLAENIWCTKIASKLARTYSDRHGLKDLARECLAIDLSKQQQCSDWGNVHLSQAQLSYAASDVLYLHRIKNYLEERLIRENRLEIAEACFSFLPMRAKLDLLGWPEDIFAH